MKIIFKLVRPLHIVLAALTYTLGASIPAYTGKPFQPALFLLGLAGSLLAQAGMALLSEVFRPHNEPYHPSLPPHQKEALRNNLLYIALGILATVACIGFIANRFLNLPFSIFYFLLTSLLLILAYGIPPLRLANRGFGELILAIHIAYIIPSIAILFQTGDNSRLLTLLLIPLTMLALTHFIIQNFITYREDEKYERQTLLRRLGWQQTTTLHHLLLSTAYLILALVPLFGFSFYLVFPAFLTLPFAIFQVIQLRAIANGNPPNWKLLTATSLAVFGLSTYFLTLTFWLR